MKIRLRDVRPDHTTFRCIIVVYDGANRTLSAFVGSTVPDERFVRLGFKRIRTDESHIGNLLLTGMYPYIVGSHGKSRSNPLHGTLLQGTRIAVRRTFNDLVYGTDDEMFAEVPRDDFIPSLSADKFSSVGGLSIRGTRLDDHYTLEFEEFRKSLGLKPGQQDDGKRIDIVLLTGLDASVAAELLSNGNTIKPEDRMLYLERLRQGSRDERVKKLQTASSLNPTGEFDADTVVALAKLQTEKLHWSDGIYSAEMDTALGLCVFESGNC